LDWLDIRASYATTLARPDFNFITPRSQINDNSLFIISGNPSLKHAKAKNYDLFVTAFQNNFGLLSAGVFYKSIENISYPWRINLFDQATADQFGWPNNVGYELRSYINSGESTVKGFEVDFQTSLRFLPEAFRGFVVNINYALPTQAPHILNLSVGYDYKKFSSRVSGTYQGVQARRYDSNKQDISFTRSQEYRNTVETYGMTGTIGIQYQIK